MIAPRRHFTTQDMKWAIPVKPESNVFVDIIVTITCQSLFEFSIQVLDFVRIYFRRSLISGFFQNRERRKIKDLGN